MKLSRIIVIFTLALCSLPFLASAQVPAPITNFTYHAWTPDEHNFISTNDACLSITNSGVTSWDYTGTNINGQWCTRATIGQVTLTFTVISNVTYRVQSHPWTPTKTGQFLLSGEWYDASLSQGWTYISPPLTNSTNGSITFQCGALEYASFYRVMAH